MEAHELSVFTSDLVSGGRSVPLLSLAIGGRTRAQPNIITKKTVAGSEQIVLIECWIRVVLVWGQVHLKDFFSPLHVKLPVFEGPWDGCTVFRTCSTNKIISDRNGARRLIAK